MKKRAYGSFVAILAAFVLLAGSQAMAQGWSWNGSLNGWSGGWNTSQPSNGSSSGWSAWQPSIGGSYTSSPSWSWSWQGGSGGSWWWSPGTSNPTRPDDGATPVEPEPEPAPEPEPEPEPAPEPEPEPEPVTPPTSGGNAAEEAYLVNAANAERAAAGKGRLATHGTLTQVARQKARDMAVNGYFDHYSPTYGSPKDMMVAAGLNPKWWGENIARGGSVEQIHQAFMESPGHRANILSAGFTHMGAGVVRQGGRLYVAEEFMQPR